ncbi:hypothetical protein KCU92_g9132, partial [Aureobasidium melanogenum]|jgi:alpha 1,2-mannosyltransferase
MDSGLTIPAIHDWAQDQLASDVKDNDTSTESPGLPDIPKESQTKPPEPWGIEPQELLWNSDLHRLRNNDDFLPFFAGISNVQDLSVTAAYGTCDYDEQELSSFHYNADASWVREPLDDEVVQPLREAWQQFVKHSMIPWESVKHKYKGRGIVIVGGGSSKDLKRIKVILRALERYGSRLPVEINFFGDEMGDGVQQELTAIYGSDKLFFNDLSQADQTWKTFKVTMENYQLKTAGIINARFAEILLLDSDNIPTSDPADLFESKTYEEYGSVFWPDHPRTRKEHPVWAVFNTPCRRDEYEFETGQLLVDKRRYFYHLQLAAWMNTQEYWREMLLGDKDLFRYAWHGLKTKYGTPTKWLTSVGFVAEQADEKGGSKMAYCGHTFGQAYPDHKDGDGGSGIAFLHGGALKTMSAPLLARLRKLHGGIFTHFKRVPIASLEDWSRVEYGVDIKLWSAGYYYNLTRDYSPGELVSADDDLDLDGISISDEQIAALELAEKDLDKNVLCLDFAHAEARPLAELGEDARQFEMLFRETGGYWMIEENYEGW